MVKYLLFLFNFVFVVGGIALVSLGALTYTRFSEYEDLTADIGIPGFKGPPIAMMVGGAIVFFIAFMGCCGAIRESPLMMSTYATILTILLILEVGAVIAAALYKDDVEQALQQGFTESMKHYGDETELAKEQTATWDSMQERIKCCGTMGFADWHNVFKNVPRSCCQDPSSCPETGLPFPVEDTTKIYTDGCYKKAVEEIGIPTLICIAAAIGGVELLGIIFGCCLAARFRNKDYRPR